MNGLLWIIYLRILQVKHNKNNDHTDTNLLSSFIKRLNIFHYATSYVTQTVVEDKHNEHI